MLLTFDEQDAIGEIANISVGAAACYLGNVGDVDVDVSIPSFKDIVNNHDNLNIAGMSVGYMLSFTAFTAGYCAFVLNDNYEKFAKLIGCQSGDTEKLNKILFRVMESAVEPIERLMEQSISVSMVKPLSDKWNPEWDDAMGSLVSISFDILLDSLIKAKIVFVYPEKVAKSIGDRFIKNGVAIMTI